MRDDNPSPENAPPGSGSKGAPPWQEMGEAWASIITAWGDLTTGWASLMTAWMRMNPFMGMNPMMGMNPFMGGPQAAAEWARQVMECMGRTTASAAPKPSAPVRPREEASTGLARVRPHAPPAQRASEDHVRGIIAHRGDTSDDLPPLADGT